VAERDPGEEDAGDAEAQPPHLEAAQGQPEGGDQRQHQHRARGGRGVEQLRSDERKVYPAASALV
jgi:hypothetical protein